jgi:hypothetical protein
VNYLSPVRINTQNSEMYTNSKLAKREKLSRLVNELLYDYLIELRLLERKRVKITPIKKGKKYFNEEFLNSSEHFDFYYTWLRLKNEK